MRPAHTTKPSSRVQQPKPTDRRLILAGKRLVLTNCAHCHSNDEGRLTGKPIDGVSASLGRIVSANITRDSVRGIGRWSDAQLVNLLRTGVDPKSHKAHFIMPRYPLMADADMRAIVAFLRSNEYAVEPTRYTANLTSEPETGFGRYTEAEFSEVMHLGKKRSGQIVHSPCCPTRC